MKPENTRPYPPTFIMEKATICLLPTEGSLDIYTNDRDGSTTYKSPFNRASAINLINMLNETYNTPEATPMKPENRMAFVTGHLKLIPYPNAGILRVRDEHIGGAADQDVPFDRASAHALIAMLNETYDIADPAAEVETSMFNMEEKHAEQLEAFMQQLIIQLLVDNGLKSVTLNTPNLFLGKSKHTLAITATMGQIHYSLQEPTE